MPNGGDPGKCALARPFFDQIKEILESFGRQNNLEYLRWYHDSPLFIFREDSTDERKKMDRSIQVGIEPLFGEEEAIFTIFVTAFSGDRMRFKGWWVAKGVLGRDQNRLKEWLEVAHGIFLAIRDEDITISMRSEDESRKPIFDTTGPLGDRPYYDI